MDINKAYLYQKGGNNNTSIIRTRLHDRINMSDLDFPTQGNDTSNVLHQGLLGGFTSYLKSSLSGCTE